MVAARSRRILFLLGWVVLLRVVIGLLASCTLLTVRLLLLALIATTHLLLALRLIRGSLGSLLLGLVAIAASLATVRLMILVLLLATVVV
jgi:hypothetical protein